jgi:hypothetical protein
VILFGSSGDDGEGDLEMKDWSDQRRAGESVSGALRDSEQAEAAAPRQGWYDQSRESVGRAEAAAKKRAMGIAAVVAGGVMMVAGAAIVVASIV